MSGSTQRLDVGSREAVLLVAGREIRVRTRSKAYLVTLLITAVAAVALPIILHLVNLSPGPTKIAVLGSDSSLSSSLQATATELGQKITITAFPDQQAGQAAVRAGHEDVLAATGPNGGVTATVDKTLPDSTRQLLQVVDQQRALGAQFTQLGATPAQAGRALAATAGSQVQVTALTRSDPQQAQHITIAIAAGC
ncbi:hypothetical protein GXW82_21340 [Streptacidiphilus sp. 4-A2]|nr:hypothetical protein [Streptacidiphilus sp. 4-A2]